MTIGEWKLYSIIYMRCGATPVAVVEFEIVTARYIFTASLWPAD